MQKLKNWSCISEIRPNFVRFLSDYLFLFVRILKVVNMISRPLPGVAQTAHRLLDLSIRRKVSDRLADFYDFFPFTAKLR